jgi:predicted RNase H-related nuclease YkuK (DUF458 family)
MEKSAQEKYAKLKSLGDGRMVTLEEALSNKDVTYRVGCDSLNVKHHSVYIMSLVGIYPDNRGAFVFYHKEKIPKIRDIQQRLWREVEMSMEFAQMLREQFKAKIEAIDFDLNVDEQYPSSRLAASAIGFANGAGFDAYCKPDKLYAIWASDHVVHGVQKVYEKRRIDPQTRKRFVG